jgi:histone-lysine N-methyltransferase SUV39H
MNCEQQQQHRSSPESESGYSSSSLRSKNTRRSSSFNQTIDNKSLKSFIVQDDQGSSSVSSMNTRRSSSSRFKNKNNNNINKKSNNQLMSTKRKRKSSTEEKLNSSVENNENQNNTNSMSLRKRSLTEATHVTKKRRVTKAENKSLIQSSTDNNVEKIKEERVTKNDSSSALIMLPNVSSETKSESPLPQLCKLEDEKLSSCVEINIMKNIDENVCAHNEQLSTQDDDNKRSFWGDEKNLEIEIDPNLIESEKEDDDDDDDDLMTDDENEDDDKEEREVEKNEGEKSKEALENENQIGDADNLDEDEVVDSVIEDIWFVNLVHKKRRSVMQFLVKWDGYPTSDNTYEPFEHIKHCEILNEFIDRKFNHDHEKIDELCRKLLKEAKPIYEKFLNRPKNSIVRKLRNFDVVEFKCSLLAYIYTYDGSVLISFIKQLRYNNILYHFYKKWKIEQEKNANMLATIMKEENNSFEISAENNVDFDPVPNFTYLSKVNYPKIYHKINNIGCECNNKCNGQSNCCPKLEGLEMVYHEVDERINARHQMIVECNDFCNCDKTCPNRPKPISTKLCIFKTKNRGWAIKTLENIPIGKFIMEYTGECLDEKEARKRSRVYEKEGMTFLFDLDYNENGQASYSIDATYQGNISRFINHSCNPNLQTWPATTCIQDPRMHKLYYFSQRFIRAGEELTIDYTGGVDKTPIQVDPNDNSVARTKCLCNSSRCRGYIF